MISKTLHSSPFLENIARRDLKDSCEGQRVEFGANVYRIP